MTRLLSLLLIVVVLTGCPPPDSEAAAKKVQSVTLDIGAIASPVSPASHAALYVLRDNGATQERKVEALKLLFDLERTQRVDAVVQRLDDLTAKLEVLLERKVEAGQ